MAAVNQIRQRFLRLERGNDYRKLESGQPEDRISLNYPGCRFLATNGNNPFLLASGPGELI